MSAERIVRIVAGFFILLSLSLGVEASPLFNLCPLTSILAKFGVKGGACR
jgi:hypothetical protein